MNTEDKELARRLRERAGEKTAHSNAALTVAYYDQSDAALDRKAASYIERAGKVDDAMVERLSSLADRVRFATMGDTKYPRVALNKASIEVVANELDSIRAALEAASLPVGADKPVGVKAYRAENAKHGWTGRVFAFDGGCLNLGRDGSAEFVFNMDELDPYYEEGKSLMLAKVSASEVEALRDLFMKAYPTAPAARVKALAEQIATNHGGYEVGTIGYLDLVDEISVALTTPSSPDVELQERIHYAEGTAQANIDRAIELQAAVERGIEEEQRLMSRLGIETRARESAEANLSSVQKVLEWVLDCLHQANPTDVSQWHIRPGRHNDFSQAVTEARSALLGIRKGGAE